MKSICCAVCLSMCLSLGFGESSCAQSSAVEPSEAGFETLVFLAPRGPLLLGVRLEVDGKGFRDWLSGFLFRKLATSRDRTLGREQLELIPARLLPRLGYDSHEALLADLSTGEGEAAVDQAEFTQFLKERLTTSFLISEERLSAVQAINVLPKFDANDDGHLSEEELANGLAHLTQQDIDDDETLSAAELLPFRDRLNPGAAIAPNPDDLPFIQIVAGGTDRLADRLVRYYSEPEGQMGLDRATMRLDEETFGRIDANGDGIWDTSETATFLTDPVRHVELAIQLGRGRSSVTHQVLPAARGTVTVESPRPDRITVTLDGPPLEIRIDRYMNSSLLFTRSFCGQRFAVSDDDDDGALDETEFPEFAGQVAASVGPLDFATMDADGDEKVTRDEMNRHLDRDSIAAQSQLEVNVTSDGRSLFQMLDENLDRRLSLRELREGFDRIATLDHDEDRRVSRVEASSPSKYLLRVGLGRPQLFSQSMMQMNDARMSTDATLPSVESLPGPVWFRKMDRNRDGDVSRREFLGPLNVFSTLDVDGDGLLSLTEAEAGTTTTSDASSDGGAAGQSR